MTFSGVDRITPWIPKAVEAAARRLFPFGFGRQSRRTAKLFGQPATVLHSVFVTDEDNGMAAVPCRRFATIPNVRSGELFEKIVPAGSDEGQIAHCRRPVAGRADE